MGKHEKRRLAASATPWDGIDDDKIESARRVAVDDGGSSIYIYEGFGKTGKAKTRAAFGGRIERGSELVHDMEGAHGAIVSDLGLKNLRRGRLVGGRQPKITDDV